jgi:hypothetical protein
MMNLHRFHVVLAETMVKLHIGDSWVSLFEQRQSLQEKHNLRQPRMSDRIVRLTTLLNFELALPVTVGLPSSR